MEYRKSTGKSWLCPGEVPARVLDQTYRAYRTPNSTGSTDRLRRTRRLLSEARRTYESRHRRPGTLAVASRPGAVVEVNHTVAETSFVQQLELQANIAGEGRCAASHHDGREEQVALVDQAGLDRVGGEIGTAHGEVTFRTRFHPPD